MLQREFVVSLVLMVLLGPGAASAQITEIIDFSGDGANAFDAPPRSGGGVAVDSSGNVYVTGSLSHNAFKITPGGTITEIINATGDGSKPLDLPVGIAVDGSGNVYVAGRESDNVFKITPGGTITEIIDSTGDGSNTFDGPLGLTVDGSGNVYATGSNTDNAFKITPGGAITEIIDSTGDGSGNPLDNPRTIALDGSSNVYVTGWLSDNAFRITPGGAVTEIIDANGDRAGNLLDKPETITVDGLGNVYLTAEGTSAFRNAFKIATPGGCSTAGTLCTITEIIDDTGDGLGNPLVLPVGAAVDGAGNVYVTGFSSRNAFKIATPGTCSTGGTPCTITEIIDITGDGSNNLDGAVGIAVDGSGNVFVAGFFTDNVFRIGGPFLGCDDSSPIAWWEFDESDSEAGASGSVVLDSTANGNDGHLWNGASRVPGLSGTAALLDGINDHVNVGSNAILDNLTAFTYSAWIHPTATGDREIFSKNNSARELRLKGMGTLRGCIIAMGGNACSDSVETVPLGTWTHVAMTYDHAGDKLLHLYIDGAEVDYAAQSTGGGGSMRNDAPWNQILGRRQNNSRPFAGMLDEMMIFDHQLADCEIEALAEGPSEPE